MEKIQLFLIHLRDSFSTSLIGRLYSQSSQSFLRYLTIILDWATQILSQNIKDKIYIKIISQKAYPTKLKEILKMESMDDKWTTQEVQTINLPSTEHVFFTKGMRRQGGLIQSMTGENSIRVLVIATSNGEDSFSSATVYTKPWTRRIALPPTSLALEESRSVSPLHLPALKKCRLVSTPTPPALEKCRPASTLMSPVLENCCLALPRTSPALDQCCFAFPLMSPALEECRPASPLFSPALEKRGLASPMMTQAFENYRLTPPLMSPVLGKCRLAFPLVSSASASTRTPAFHIFLMSRPAPRQTVTFFNLIINSLHIITLVVIVGDPSIYPLLYSVVGTRINYDGTIPNFKD